MRWSKLIILCLLCIEVTSSVAQSSTIGTRLSKLKTKVKFTANTSVEAYINTSVKDHKKKWEVALGKAGYYLPEMQDTLERYGIPQELAFAALGWSLFNHEKISEDGGSGFWQMRYVDAKKHGVYISSFVDMRRDYRIATSAASKYLSELYKEYGDWYVSLVAFAVGEVEVNKAIRLSEGSKDYWALQKFLPERYHHLVPAFITGAYLNTYYKEHLLKPVPYDQDSVTSVTINEWSSLYQISKAIKSDHNTLRDLNPIFKKDVIPNASRTYSLRIPVKHLQRFNELGDSVYTFPVSARVDGEVSPVKPEEQQNRNEVHPVAKSKPAGKAGSKVVYYTVRSGDFLGRIADIYDVGVSQVRKWNGLSGDRINVNQKLKIYVPASKYSTYSKYNGYSRSQLDQIIRKD